MTPPINLNLLAVQMRQTRDVFGFIYRRVDYVSPKLRELWKTSAPWASGEMVPYAQNMSDAILRDISFRMPVHDEAGLP